jgi:hypothetical protein
LPQNLYVLLICRVEQFPSVKLHHFNFNQPMPKKGKLSKARRHSATDEVSRKALQAGIKELREKHFAPWTPSLTEGAVFEIAEGLEQVAKGLRNLAASGTLPALPAK